MLQDVLGVDYPVDLCILVSYFIFIGLLLWRIRSVFTTNEQDATMPFAVFVGLAAASFVATWYFMFAYFGYSFGMWRLQMELQHEPWTLNIISHWLHDISLFDEAWRTVSTGDWQWLWSIQICAFTVAVWMPLMALEGSRHRIPYLWVFMLLGHVVAISVSSSLFFAALILVSRSSATPPKQPESSMRQVTAVGLLIVTSMAALKTVDDVRLVAHGPDFMAHLLLMHGLSLIPLVLTILAPRLFALPRSYGVVLLYILVAAANLVLMKQQAARAIQTLPSASEPALVAMALRTLADTFLFHPAQSSISSDAAALYFITIAWIMYRQSSKSSSRLFVLVFALLTFIASPTVSLPLYLALDEYIHLPSSILSKKRQ
ncbi:hypothetical protein DM01DRAFT_1317660 [Hesseltinella vesiculosa]|uniref:Uncharacterized protein n=1 Tax=Hesseltinella vesiculosa TaxID=101127 RepID=A0A1X2GRE4_9FUNG|nr:hypothetical protein DM01DRAFT_1317660 [Hesseltinella vesiculosa]